MELRTISIEEIIQIHESLVQDFACSDNPLEPPGIRSMALLQSAVSRQFTSIGEQYKYPDAVGNAATLAYGLCNDHPFHNGNKRTALVSMLVHLDKNKLVLKSTRDTELFDMIISTAMHTTCLTLVPSRRHRSDYPHGIDSDGEVLAIRQWLQKRAIKLTRGERQITFRQLRRLLEKFGYTLQNPHKNSIDLVKIETVRKGIIKRHTVPSYKHIGSIDYPGDNEFVPLRVLKYARKTCRLTEEDGIDSDSFYDEPAVIDAFINKYRIMLRRLSKR